MIYLDHAATTKSDEETIQVMNDATRNFFANPSSLHDPGIAARKRLNVARRNIARYLGTEKQHILFTGTATEAINTVIKGTFFKHPKKTIITSNVEHNATLNACKFVKAQGGHVITLESDATGNMPLDELEKVLNDHTVSLVSLIYANNELGTIIDVAPINELCKKYQAKLHLDMVQGPAHQRIKLDELDIDYASFAAHKFYGPRGVGILYFKAKDTFDSLIHGGRQEHQKRAGTENLAGIVGCEHALGRCYHNIDTWEATIRANAEIFLETLKKNNIDFRLNGPSFSDKRLPSILNIGFKDQDAQIMAFKLNEAGICVSLGSACHSEVIEASHVLQGIRVPEAYIDGSMRLSLSHEETKTDMIKVANTMAELVKSGECKK